MRLKILIVKNGDVAAELASLSAGHEPEYSYISEIYSLRSKGALFVLGHATRRSEYSYNGVTAKTLLQGRSLLSTVRLHFQIWRELARLRPDVVIVLHPWEFLIVPYVWCRINRGRFLPCIPRPPNVDNIRVLRKLLAGLVIRPLLRSCPVILARATAIKQNLIDWHIAQECVSVYLPPYSSAFFDTEDGLQVDPGKFNIVFVGRLVKLKGVFELIDIFAALLHKKPLARLYVIGAGPERNAMERRVRSLKIEHAVTFLGEVPQKDIHGFLAPADVAVLPSHQEGIGKTALEALLSGLPVLATRDTGFSEFIKHNYNGFLLPRGDIDRFVDELVNLIEDPSRLATLKENANATRAKIMEGWLTFEIAVSAFISSNCVESEDSVCL